MTPYTELTLSAGRSVTRSTGAEVLIMGAGPDPDWLDANQGPERPGSSPSRRTASPPPPPAAARMAATSPTATTRRPTTTPITPAAPAAGA
jgi:hypothetical protein